MNIIRLHKKPKSEDKYMYPFLFFLYRGLYKKVQFKAIPKQPRYNTPDYYVPTTKELIEIKGAHDAKDRQRSAQWGKIINNLRKQIKNNKKLKKINGLYSIATPPVFKFPTDKVKIKDAAEQLLQAIIDNKNSITFHNVTFKLEKVSDEGNGVYFSAMGLVGSFDPAQTIDENIRSKLATANKQLGFKLKGKKINKKIVLLTNHYHLLHWDWDLYKAVSYSYQQLLTYKNIDEIWFQNPKKDGTYSHKLLYTKQFLSGYHNKNIEINQENAFLFSNWFSALEKMGDEHKERLFISLKSFLNKKKPHVWFKDSISAREEMVQLGIWLIEKKRFDDAVWLIEKFINDPSPEEPDSYTGSPEFNYHQQILEGKDPYIITTVLGHLAWTIQKLAARRKEENKKYTIKALGYTKSLMNHKNYYVKLQAIIPLIEIAKRRQWLSGWGKRPRIGVYKEFHNLVFSLVKIVKNNPKCVAIAKWLCNVFAYYKDLSTNEAIEVLDALRVTEESAGLFLYYGIYRGKHYQDQKIEFNAQKLEKKLKNLIKSKANKDQALKINLVWHFWKLLDENPNEFDKLKEWISLFLKLPYEPEIYGNLLRIIEDWIVKKPDIVIPWYKTLISNIAKEADTEEKARNFRPTTKTGEVLTELAKKQPNELEGIVKKLVKLWKLGAFIGSPKEIFGSYGAIQDEDLRGKTETRFKKWYREMKKMNPKIEKIHWK